MGLLQSIFGAGNKSEVIKEMISNGAVVIDVRSPGEFQQGHVRGSKNIPLDRISSRIDKIQKMNKPIVLCCASGNRSGQATRILKAQGIECENGGSWTAVRAIKKNG